MRAIIFVTGALFFVAAVMTYVFGYDYIHGNGFWLFILGVAGAVMMNHASGAQSSE